MNHRERLYRHYLTTQVRADVASLRAGLARRGPFLKRVIERWVPPDRTQRILDIGCGYGAILHFLREAGYTNLIGIDASAEQVAAAHELGLDVVQQGSLLGFLRQTRDASCDVVIAFDVLEHFTKPELLELTDEIQRVLRGGGRLIVHVPNAEGIFPGRILFGDLTHEMAFTRQSLQQLFSVCGFARVTVAEDAPVPHGLLSSVRLALWTVLRSLFRLIHAAETGDTGRDLILTECLLAVAERD
jgi:SAM-dependent methyltransferase